MTGVRWVFVSLLLLGLAPGVRGQDAETNRRAASPELRRKRAIHDGLRFLARSQQTDGSWTSSETGGGGVVGITSLAVLAFMAAGHQEDRGEFANFRGRNVIRKGVDYLLKRSLPPSRKDPAYSDTRGYPTGYIYVPTDGDSRMHGHGYATQVLVLAYGTGRSADPRTTELKRKIQLAVHVLERAQTITGGWGYEPKHATSHEGSVTVTVIQALRLARDAGFVVDRRVQEAGLKYLKESQKKDGSFRYSQASERSSAALTAAALTAMHGFGEYYSGSVRRGLEYLRDKFTAPQHIQWVFYGNYYGAQAFYRAGGADWSTWQRRVVPYILDLQDAEGGWNDREVGNTRASHGRSFATAFACLALAVPDGFLPLFQR